MTKHNNLPIWHMLSVTAIFMLWCTPATAEVWTLEKSIQRAFNDSPEQQELTAGISIRKYKLQQADIWPNPTVTLRTQNRLGMNDGTGNYNLDQITVTQALPIWRLQQQKKVADKQLASEQALAQQSLLSIQADIARLYYALLFSHETLQLAKQRQQFTDKIVHSQSNRSSQVVRYINPIDRHRIELLHEAARRNLLTSQAAFIELKQQFRLRLQLQEQEPVQLPSMQLAITPPSIAELQNRLEQGSSTIKQMLYQLGAGEANIGLERIKRFNDPELTLIHERDVLGGRRQNFQGIMLSISIPLWNQNENNIARAEAETTQLRSRLQMTLRDLSSQLQQSHLHLTHLLEQARSFQKQMIEPAEHLLSLTRQSYAVGEVNSLNLIDAYNSYFNALNNNLDLSYQSNLATVKLHQLIGDPDLYMNPVEATQ